MWSSWREEKENDCRVKCCDTGGPVIRQIRNCTIHKRRCELLDKCSDYGVTERDISCYNACECMPNAGWLTNNLTNFQSLRSYWSLLVSYRTFRQNSY